MQAVPLAVTGVDALGRPFQERTSTLVINCHGARYQSKHYVLKNMWVTLEIPQPEPGRPPRSLRGKVTWIQRPRTVRQLFQIAVELELPGNFWGVAFPPEDWFPPAGSDSTASAPLAVENQRPFTSDDSHLAGQFSGDNLHVMPPPAAAASQEAPQYPVELLQEVNRLMAEAHQKLQAAARDAVTQAVTSESGSLLEDLHARIKEAESAVQAAAMQAADRGAEVVAAKLNEAQAAAFSVLRTELPNALAPQLEQVTHELSAELAKAAKARFAAFDEELQSALREAQGTIEKLSRETAATRNTLQASLQRFEAETHRRSEDVHRLGEQASREQFDKATAREEETGRRLHEQLSSATEEAANNWRLRLEADLALASSRWEQTIESSMAGAANRAAEYIEQRRQASADQQDRTWTTRADEIRNAIETSIGAAADRAAEHIDQRRQASTDQVEREWAARADQIRNSIESVVRDAESALSTVRAEFDRETARAHSSLSEMQQAISRGHDFSVRFEGLGNSTIEELQSRLRTLVATETERFAQQAEDVIAGANRKMQPLLETAGRESIDRLASEFETRMAAQLDRAAEVLEKLAAAEKMPETLLRVHQEHLERISEQSATRAVARLQEDLTAVEKEFEQKVEMTRSNWIAELEKRANEVQVAATDSLFKSAEWHQKRAESQAQTAFEKMVEEAGAALREKAGELSGLFAAELDHYSRSYVEHSQTQMDEAVKETFERARGLFSEIADTTVAAFTDEVQRGAHGELDAFQQSLEKTGAESRSQIEGEAQRIQENLRRESDQSLTDFQHHMAAAVEKGVINAGQLLEKQLEPVVQTWRELTEKHHQQIHQNYERLGNESVETYKKRLENVSNSWMVATVTTLDRQSQELISGVAKSAEDRLRETVSQVFAGVGDTLRARLQEIAASLASHPLAPGK